MQEIRKAKVEDIEPIKAILFNALNEYQIAIPDNYLVTDIDSIGRKNTTYLTFVLIKDETIIGFIILRPISKDYIELKRLYLISFERGRGLGRMLLKLAIQYGQNNKYKTIQLETASKFNEAVSLYTRNGFLLLRDAKKVPGHDLAFEKRLESPKRSKMP